MPSEPRHKAHPVHRGSLIAGRALFMDHIEGVCANTSRLIEVLEINPRCLGYTGDKGDKEGHFLWLCKKFPVTITVSCAEYVSFRERVVKQGLFSNPSPTIFANSQYSSVINYFCTEALLSPMDAAREQPSVLLCILVLCGATHYGEEHLLRALCEVFLQTAPDAPMPSVWLTGARHDSAVGACDAGLWLQRSGLREDSMSVR